MEKQIITIEVNTFDVAEAQKVFTHLCRNVLKMPASKIIRTTFRLKSHHDITWHHVFELINRYGITSELKIQYDPFITKKKLLRHEMNYLRLQKGMAALPEKAAVESTDTVD